MKKHLFLCLFAAMTFGGVFTSCSDDDSIVNPITTESTFTVDNGLTLTYNGEALLGKKVVYTPSETEPTKATLTLMGVDFDLVQQMRSSRGINFNTPGVLPGSIETKLDINVTINGDKCLFEGKSETEFCTFAYKGEVSKSNLTLNLTEVALKEKGLVGQWNLDQKVMDDFGWEVISTPLHLEWDSKEQFKVAPFPGFPEVDMPGKSVVGIVLDNLMLCEKVEGEETKKITVLDMLVASFKDVRFAEDGNVTANIVDYANGKTTAEVSPKNVAFYVVDKMPSKESRGSMRLFLNLETINEIANANKSKSRADLDINSLLAMVNPLIQNGISLTLISNEEGKLSVILDTEFLMPIFKNVILPLLSDETIASSLLEMIKNNEDFKSFVPTAEAVLKQLPGVINTTDKMEIGLNFTLNK